MDRRKLLLIHMILFVGLFLVASPILVPGAGAAEDEKSYFKIRGEDKTPSRSSYEYDAGEHGYEPRFETSDTPPAPVTKAFDEPVLAKKQPEPPHPEFERPSDTVVEDYSMLELLGIGLGIAIAIGLL